VLDAWTTTCPKSVAAFNFRRNEPWPSDPEGCGWTSIQTERLYHSPEATTEYTAAAVQSIG